MTIFEQALYNACWDLANYTFRDKDTSLGEETDRLVAYYLNTAEPEVCSRCHGKGLEGQDDRPGLLLDSHFGTEECRECHGTGKVPPAAEPENDLSWRRLCTCHTTGSYGCPVHEDN
jgi:hypothetical protein